MGQEPPASAYRKREGAESVSASHGRDSDNDRRYEYKRDSEEGCFVKLLAEADGDELQAMCKRARASVKWTDSQGLHALLNAWTGKLVECPTCDRVCEQYGDVLNLHVWCPQCKTGFRAGVARTPNDKLSDSASTTQD